MIVYAESSAVLAWLFGESRGAAVRAILAAAEVVLASDLTVLECQRVLVRAGVAARLSEADASGLRGRLARAAASWTLLRVDDDALERAGRAFPAEPVRTLDALHLSSALAARAAVPDVQLLTLDDRIRLNGAALGFAVLPDG